MKKILGLGTAAIGRPLYINIKPTFSDFESIESFKQSGRNTLEEAYKKGIRYFDTAPGYGHAEELLIKWLGEKNDKSIEVATKWGYTYVANFDKNATQQEEKEHSLSKLNQQWAYSKQLLPYLTTYQIHSATLETGVLKNQAILERLAALKTKYNLKIGITTTGANQVEVIKEALLVKVENQSLFDVFQVTYNILDQSLAQIQNILQEQNKRIVIKEALANGRLFPNDKFPHYQTLYQTLNKLAQKYQTGIDAIALRFCMDTIGAYRVLSGVDNPIFLESNTKSEDFKLDDKDILELKKQAIKPTTYWEERTNLQWN